MRPAVPGITLVPGTDLAISLELLENSETTRFPDNVYNSEMGCLDWNRLSGPLELRNWRPGDQYQPVGIPAAKKIKMLFQHARIPVWDRRGGNSRYRELEGSGRRRSGSPVMMEYWNRDRIGRRL